MLNALMTMTGKVKIERYNAQGELTFHDEVHNLVVTAGKVVVANRLGNSSPTKAAMTHMALGTGATAAAAGDTTLQTEAGRVALTSATPSSNTVTYVATFPAGTATGSITEAGLLNASSLGDLLCRTVFTAVPKGASDSLTLTWTVTVS